MAKQFQCKCTRWGPPKGAASNGQFAEKAAHQDTLQHECSPGMTWSGAQGLGQTQVEVAFKTSVWLSGVLLMHLRETQSKVWRPKINNRPNRYKISTLHSAFGPQTGTKPRLSSWVTYICKRKNMCMSMSVCMYLHLCVCQHYKEYIWD